MNYRNIENSENYYFSVVIPVYNKAPHIDRSIRSVLEQTYQNFEIVIVNDASTDGSLSEIKRFHDERIRLFHRQTPGHGGYAARNLGIKEARGEWVAFLDADDEWYPEHLMKMYELSILYPDACLMSSGWEECEHGVRKKNGFFQNNRSNHSLRIGLLDYFKWVSKKKQPIWTSVACIKKSSVATENLFPENLGVTRGGDMFAWLKMICLHKALFWSCHLGAIYHLDSVNMVTKNSKSSPQLLSKKSFINLSQDFNFFEKQGLANYFNKWLTNIWLGDVVKDSVEFNIRKMLIWKYDYSNALLCYCISLIPKTVLKTVYKLKRHYKHYIIN